MTWSGFLGKSLFRLMILSLLTLSLTHTHTLSQMLEIGDLQQTLNMKQDYRKLQYSLQQKNKLYQDAVCEKLELQKQVI